jgi:hypothetical protein
MNRRAFIKGLGLFMILPGAGRIWRPTPRRLQAFWWQTNCAYRYMSKEYLDAMYAHESSIAEQLRLCSEMYGPFQPLDLNEVFDQIHAIRKARPKPPGEMIFL